MDPELPKLITVDEAAKLLGMSPTWLYGAINSGEFRPAVVRMGKTLRISRPALLRWLETVGMEQERVGLVREQPSLAEDFGISPERAEQLDQLAEKVVLEELVRLLADSPSIPWLPHRRRVNVSHGL
jgi:excisionase family DNA binding protein